jgi:threonine/homoserine/homoserine lactone efflux protein
MVGSSRAVLLATAHVLLPTPWSAALIPGARRGRVLVRPRVQQALDAATGLVMVGFGLRLGMSRQIQLVNHIRSRHASIGRTCAASTG